MNEKNQIDWEKEIAKKVKQNQGFLNIAHEISNTLETFDDHQVVLKFLKKSWMSDRNAIEEIRAKDLVKYSNQLARAFKKKGFKKGDVVFSLLPRRRELYFSVLGALRAGLIFSPLFSSFGPDPILTRMKEAQGKILITLSSFYWKKISLIRDLLDLKLLLIIDDDGSFHKIEGAILFEEFFYSEEGSFFVEKTLPSDPALLHFTSGTTGTPKGVLHAHQAIIYHKYSAEVALGLKAGERFWCTADAGWVTGMSYGVLAPLILKATLIVDEEEFNAKRWYEILNYEKIEIWYTSPTALRMLMKAGDELAGFYQFPFLKVAASVGEPLNPEIIKWAKNKLGITLLDNWWQTETGGIMIANRPGELLKLGSMGKPLPGVEVKILDRQIAIKKGWPSMFMTYLNQKERFEKSFLGDWYLSGDEASMDEDGYFWFIGRMDDVIKTSGHLVGPFEIESLLMEHPAVLEACVIGIPDEVAGELVKAYVTLKSAFYPSKELKQDILAFARNKLGVSIAPREIDFKNDLPKTRSGKMMRRLLRARELHLPEGDLSTLEVSG